MTEMTNIIDDAKLGIVQMMLERRIYDALEAKNITIDPDRNIISVKVLMDEKTDAYQPLWEAINEIAGGRNVPGLRRTVTCQYRDEHDEVIPNNYVNWEGDARTQEIIISLKPNFEQVLEAFAKIGRNGSWRENNIPGKVELDPLWTEFLDSQDEQSRGAVRE